MASSQLSEREKLALSFAAYTGCDDWAYIYHMSLERPRKEISRRSSAVSRWKHSPKVIAYFKDQQAAAGARIVEAKKEAIRNFIDSLPEYISRAISENRDIDPEEFALPPRLQQIRPAMSRDDYEAAGRRRGQTPGETLAVGTSAADNEDSNTHEGDALAVLPNKVDFRDRDELLRFYNDKANETKDDKIKLECLARISDLERFKAETSQKNDIVRAYLPQRCYVCPLYVSQKSKIEEDEQ